MSCKLELQSYCADYTAVEKLLDDAKSLNDKIGILQFGKRLELIKSKIDALLKTQKPHANLAIFFGGQPVFGSRGILASFAGRAVGFFQDIVSKHLALIELGALGERGKVPFAEQTALSITGIAHGSFGFILEELNTQESLIETPLKKAVEDVVNMIHQIGSESDDDFVSTFESLDYRTLASLREFFRELDSSAATVRLVNDKKDYKLPRDAVSRARCRVDATEISTTEEELLGVMKGILPIHKKFEFLSEDGRQIYGVVSEDALAQYGYLTQKTCQIFEKYCTIVVNKKTTKVGNNPEKHSYSLLEFKKIDQCELN